MALKAVTDPNTSLSKELYQSFITDKLLKFGTGCSLIFLCLRKLLAEPFVRDPVTLLKLNDLSLRHVTWHLYDIGAVICLRGEFQGRLIMVRSTNKTNIGGYREHPPIDTLWTDILWDIIKLDPTLSLGLLQFR